jgi:hypothetical protein
VKSAFRRELVEVRRAPGHQAAVIGADVPHADIVTHDDQDVRPAPPSSILRREGAMAMASSSRDWFD